MLYYVPLEPYEERYTMQLSSDVDGWFTDVLDRHDIDYLYVDGDELTGGFGNKNIKDGVVLDACGRGYWACSQVMELLRMLHNGTIKDGDSIYFEDFWHPGISALPYARHIMGVDFKMYALVHAQSVDPHDFTHPMREWMRDFERGESKVLDGMFVTSLALRDLLTEAGLNNCPIHNTGLPYNSNMVIKFYEEEAGLDFDLSNKMRQVVFTSRWDKEKCPGFYVEVARKVREIDPSIQFLVTTSRKELKGNDEKLNDIAHYLKTDETSPVKVLEGLEKWQYYSTLRDSLVQFNCADQDFVSWTLLEATTFGCRPVYPDYLSFPEVLGSQYLYKKGDVDDAAAKVIEAVQTAAAVQLDYSNIYKRFDSSALRMLQAMKIIRLS